MARQPGALDTLRTPQSLVAELLEGHGRNRLLALEWADRLLDRGEADDRSRAEKLLHKALDVARARGYAQIQRRAERALASLG